MNRMLLFFVTLVASSFSCSALAQEMTPKRMGFDAQTLQVGKGPVNYFVSTEGKPLDQKRKLPLVLFLQGSGPTPIFWGQGKRIGTSLMFDASEFPGFHFVVIGKPGVRFAEADQRIESKIYDQNLSLSWRVNAASAVIDALASKPYIDISKIVVIGHSEGADVVPWLGKNKNITHFVGLAPSGESQMLDFILFARREFEQGKVSREQTDQRVAKIKQAYEAIFADPKSTTRKWKGETYLRWSTFFEPSMEAWTSINRPIYLGICRDDVNTPAECGESIELEFIRRQKKNLTSKVWPCDHYFIEKSDAKPNDHRAGLLTDVLNWVGS